VKCADEYRFQFYRFGLQVNILSSSPGFHVDVSVIPDQEVRGGEPSTGKVDKIDRTVTLEPSYQTQVELTSPMEPAFGYT